MLSQCMYFVNRFCEILMLLKKRSITGQQNLSWLRHRNANLLGGCISIVGQRVSGEDEAWHAKTSSIYKNLVLRLFRYALNDVYQITAGPVQLFFPKEDVDYFAQETGNISLRRRWIFQTFQPAAMSRR